MRARYLLSAKRTVGKTLAAVATLGTGNSLDSEGPAVELGVAASRWAASLTKLSVERQQGLRRISTLPSRTCSSPSRSSWLVFHSIFLRRFFPCSFLTCRDPRNAVAEFPSISTFSRGATVDLERQKHGDFCLDFLSVNSVSQSVNLFLLLNCP